MHLRGFGERLYCLNWVCFILRLYSLCIFHRSGALPGEGVLLGNCGYLLGGLPLVVSGFVRFPLCFGGIYQPKKEGCF